MTEGEHRFQVNLRGIIALLSNHLYSGPAVFVRELLQNAVDALRARELRCGAEESRIEFSLVEGSAGAPATLVVEDNGIGLTEGEVHQFLATIGESSKRDDLGAAREDFIGQFGIGLLSCFMVADEIVMVTRSAAGDGPAVEWRGRPDGTYGVRRLARDASAGTRVFLRCKRGAEAFYTPEKLRELIAHYGGLLTVPVWLSWGGEKGARVQVNEAAPPWRTNRPSQGELLAYGQELLGARFSDAIVLHSDAGEVEGVAFVLAEAPSPSARQRHRLYLKNMLVSEQAQNLLPPWAFFVRCVLNANKLRPTASRENLYEDDALEAAREELGNGLRNWLVAAARNDPERVRRFLAVHFLAIKGLAVHDEEFYRLFIDMLPFETTRGTMTLGEYRREHPTVTYAATVDQFRQIAAVAAAQGLCVINAGYTHDQDLLERLGEVFPGAAVEKIDAAALSQSFEDLSIEEHDAAFELEEAATGALRKFRCAAEVKRFKPASLVALYNISDEGLLQRNAAGAAEQADEHWAGLLAGAIGGRGSSPYARLCFNYNNALVQRLAGLKDAKLRRRVVELVYVQSLMAGHYPLSKDEMRLLNEGLLDLISISLGEGRSDGR
jgi:molecular chaperone HtpG